MRSASLALIVCLGAACSGGGDDQQKAQESGQKKEGAQAAPETQE